MAPGTDTVWWSFARGLDLLGPTFRGVGRTQPEPAGEAAHEACPECRGIWLDRGELDKILDRAEAEASRSAVAPAAPQRDAQPSSRPAYDDRDRREDSHSGYRGKKKEHWLGVLFG